MTARRPGTSRALTWTLCIIAVPVLYVLTLPPTVFFVATRFASSPTARDFMVPYIAPYNWLMAQRPLSRPLASYMEFWREKFGYSPIMP